MSDRAARHLPRRRRRCASSRRYQTDRRT